MTHGDPCDLTGEPRRTSVFYICHPAADNEVISIIKKFSLKTFSILCYFTMLLDI